MKSKLISVEQAVSLIKDGDKIVVGGFVGSGHPEALTSALEQRFINEQHPRDLELYFVAGQGDSADHGLNHFGHEGMVKKQSAGIGAWHLN